MEYIDVNSSIGMSKQSDQSHPSGEANLMEFCQLMNAELANASRNTRSQLLSGETSSKTKDTKKYSQSKVLQSLRQRQYSWTLSCVHGTAGDTIDAISVSTQVKMTEASRWLRMPKEECPDIQIRIPPRQKPKGLSSIEDPVVALERNLHGHPMADLLWKRKFEDVILEKGREKEQTWECLCVQKKLGFFLSVFVDDVKMVRKEDHTNFV